MKLLNCFGQRTVHFLLVFHRFTGLVLQRSGAGIVELSVLQAYVKQRRRITLDELSFGNCLVL